MKLMIMLTPSMRQL